MAILIRGAGDIATGIALRLYRAGFQIVMTDLPQPTSIRRTVCFSEALRLGEMLVEDVCARRAGTAQEALDIAAAGDIAVLADPECALLPQLHPAALVDAILAKHNLGTHRNMAPVVVAVGPGFTAGEDCHAAVETMRGHTLGRVIYCGSPIPNTGVPGIIGGYGAERVMRSPAAGVFEPKMDGEGRRSGSGGERPAHALHHRRLPAGPSSRRTDSACRHEVRRYRPPLPAIPLLPGVG